jgi:hypothetical protein
MPVPPPNPNQINPRFFTPGGAGTGLNGPLVYRLHNGSPARANGAVIGDNGGRDYRGHPLPQVCAPDRGAFQDSAYNDATC